MITAYKDSKYKALVKENQNIVKKIGNPYYLADNDPLLLKFKKNEDILGTYLLDNFSDKFRILKFRFADIEPHFKINFYSEDMIDNDNSQPLEESSFEIKQVWDKIRENGYTPQLNDIVRIFYLNIQNRYYPSLAFFVDEDGVFVTSGDYYAPDKFYNLLERLGLGENFNQYIYRNSGAYFRRNKWPFTVHTMEKL